MAEQSIGWSAIVELDAPLLLRAVLPARRGVGGAGGREARLVAHVENEAIRAGEAPAALQGG
jgi:hypothetical protein